nr:50S ribosomal protein L11 methyltransferase [Lachnospiraceae bacterium]
MEWKKFVLTTTTEATDFVSGVLLENGINSFEIEDGKQISAEDKEAMYIDILPELTDDGTAKMIFYMDMNTDKAEEKRILDGIREGLEELKLFVNVGEASIIESVTDEKEWIDKWKEFFEPFTVDDILIRPTWKNVENEGDYKMVLQIDPGTAFGTGLHETTQLCIRQLRKYITNETNLLDVGCGSGILSVIGRKLGAGSYTHLRA